MHVQLIKPWNGFQAGYEFPIMSRGEAKILIQRGLAKHVLPDVSIEESRSGPSDVVGGANERTDNAGGSKEAVRDRNKRHRSR